MLPSPIEQRALDPAPSDEPASDPTSLRREIARLREMLDLNSDWIWEVDAAGHYTYVSRHCLAMLGYEPYEMLGRTPFDFMPEDEAARIGAVFGEIAAAKRHFSHLLNRNVRSDGRVVVLETSGVPLLGPDGALLGYRGIDRDVTEREAANARLRHMARHDSLTDLPNRLYLREHLAIQLADPDRAVSVFAIDLDRFKPVNDRLGHGAGDLVLREVGRRLGDLARSHDGFASRIGGDEFVLVSDGAGPAALRLTEALRRQVGRPIAVGDETVRVGASVGVAHRCTEATVDTLLAAADRALYRCKPRPGDTP